MWLSSRGCAWWVDGDWDFLSWVVEEGGDMEFKDKLVDDQYSDLRAEEDDLEDQLTDVRDKIRDLIENNEQE